jgi:phthalate 4,5-dioxygenase oxygenase subunit
LALISPPVMRACGNASATVISRRRTKERLGASDIAIVQFRRVMVDAVRRFAAGEPAIGTTSPHVPLAKIRSFEGIVPKTTNWRTLAASEEELAMLGDAADAPQPRDQAASPAD